MQSTQQRKIIFGNLSWLHQLISQRGLPQVGHAAPIFRISKIMHAPAEGEALSARLMNLSIVNYIVYLELYQILRETGEWAEQEGPCISRFYSFAAWMNDFIQKLLEANCRHLTELVKNYKQQLFLESYRSRLVWVLLELIGLQHIQDAAVKSQLTASYPIISWFIYVLETKEAIRKIILSRKKLMSPASMMHATYVHDSLKQQIILY